jgi:phosphatidylserine decarboxylase
MPDKLKKVRSASPASLGYALTRRLPRHGLTRAAGALMGLEVPRSLRSGLYRGYCAATGARADEAGEALSSYGSLDAFFTRKLKAGSRSWTADGSVIASPADGRVAQCGDNLADGHMIQAKGLTYQLSELLGEEASAFEGGAWATVYLSPADYHRVHPPCRMNVERVHWLGNQLWPVNGLSVPFVEDLFVVNERVSLIGTSDGPDGSFPVALVLVAATVVGGIELYHDELPFRRAHDGRRHDVSLETPWTIEPESPVGAFHLGSTAIFVVGQRSDGAVPRVEQRFRFSVSAAPPVNVGAPMIRFSLD